MRAAWQKQPDESAWLAVTDILRSPDLIVVVAMAAIGLFATIGAALFYPSFFDIIVP
jgi:hypothetical protein